MSLPRSLLSMTALALLGTASILPVNGAIEPAVIAERYYSSGRSERHQKTSPTLPYCAPIPDSYDTSSTTSGSRLAPGSSSSPGTTAGSTTTSSATSFGSASGSTSTQSTTTGSTTSGSSIITPSSTNIEDTGVGTDGAGSTSTKKGITTGRRGRHGTSFTLPEEIGRVEGPRDMNLIQVEPTVMNEGFYVSGKSERHQNITTLPIGAPIPDRYSDSELQSQNTLKPASTPLVNEVVEGKPGAEAKPASDAKPSNEKP